MPRLTHPAHQVLSHQPLTLFTRPARRPALIGALAILVFASLPPASTFGALAAAAGTILEATPFIVGAALLPRVALFRFLPSLACGCGGALPSALALPAIALTWLAFGPAVAIARIVAALSVWLVTRLPRAARSVGRHRETTLAHGGDRGSSQTQADAEAPDPLADLATLGVASFVAALFSELLRSHQIPLQGPASIGVSFTLGCFAGAIAPCATAGVGAAMALRTADPAAAFGLLATSGLFRFRLRIRKGPNRDDGTLARDAHFAFAGLAAIGLWLSIHGTQGLLNPRLAVLVVAGCALCAWSALRGRRTSSRIPMLAPAVLAIALIVGSPPPAESAATIPFDLYPGRAVAFVGHVAKDRPDRLVRSAILCCRADAQTLSLTLDRRLAAGAGTWVSVRGIAIVKDGAFVLRTDTVRAVAPPADPYLYL